MKPGPVPAPRQTLIARLSARGGVVDRARQIATDLGARPYRVFVVWLRWTGEKRGEGDEHVAARHELVPTPTVDFGGLTRTWFLTGIWPTGTCRVAEVAPSYTLDQLEGRLLPDGTALPRKDGEKVEFFYEVALDTRGDAPAQRGRFRLANVPSFEAENVQWVLTLERVSGDLGRNGQPIKPGAR